MAKYFVSAADEVVIHFVYCAERDDLMVLEEGQAAPEGYEANWVAFRMPGWGDEMDLLVASSRPTAEGEVVLDPLLLLANRVRRLVKGWSFDQPLERLEEIDPKIMTFLGQELGKRI